MATTSAFTGLTLDSFQDAYKSLWGNATTGVAATAPFTIAPFQQAWQPWATSITTSPNVGQVYDKFMVDGEEPEQKQDSVEDAVRRAVEMMKG